MMVQEVIQKPEPGALVGSEDVSIPVIEVSSIAAIEQMIQAGQSHCSINGVVLQNGVTTTQVCLTECQLIYEIIYTLQIIN